MAKPVPNSWVSIQDIVIPKHVSSNTASHFHFCHIRPSTELAYYHEGKNVAIHTGSACFILGSVRGEAYLVYTRNSKSHNLYASDIINSPSSFSSFELFYPNFFQGPWNVYYFKPNLLQVP
ncbi:hypothetical protein ACVWXL_005775 [Bradyrhizobium sp. GM22.5]